MITCEICNYSFEKSPYKTVCSDQCYIEKGVKKVGDCWIDKGTIKHSYLSRREFVWKLYKPNQPLIIGPISDNNLVIIRTCKNNCLNPDHLTTIAKGEQRRLQNEKAAKTRLEQKQRHEESKKQEELKKQQGIYTCIQCKTDFTHQTGQFCSGLCALKNQCNTYYGSGCYTAAYDWQYYKGVRYQIKDLALIIKYDGNIHDSRIPKSHKCKHISACVNPDHLELLPPIHDFLKNFNKSDRENLLAKYRNKLFEHIVNELIKNNYDFEEAKSLYKKLCEVDDY